MDPYIAYTVREGSSSAVTQQVGGLVVAQADTVCVGVVIEKDFWRCVEEGPGMRILRCSDGVNCMVCDMDQVSYYIQISRHNHHGHGSVLLLET